MPDDNNNTPDSDAQRFANVDHSPINEFGGSVTPEEHLYRAEHNGFTFTGEFPEADELQSRNDNQELPDKELVKAALAVIPSDTYDDWFRIAGALYQSLGDDGHGLFEEWSMKSAKYKASECEQKWREARKITDVGLGTILHIADQADPAWRKRYNIDKLLPQSRWFGERAAPIPPALVKGILPQIGVATIGGQSGTGKSFHAIHLGVCLIPDCQQHFYIDKYRIKRKGGVLYLVLEGKPSFPLRVTAAFERMLNKQLEFGEQFKLPFAWNTYAPNLFEKGPDNLLRLADRESKRMRQEFGVDLVAVFLDTMGLAACYENENMAAQVQRVVAGLNRVSDETGSLSINVDHMGKDQDAGMRGTSAKRDCVETILACFIDRDKDNKPTNHRMQLFKVRDGEEGRVIPYRLEQVDMGVDEEGDRVSTAIIRWEPDRPPQPKRRPPRKLKTDITLERAINEVGLPVDPDVLKKVFYKFHGGANHAANTAWHRAVDAEGLVLKDGKLDHPL